MLTDLFGIIETNGASGVPLTTSVTKTFTFDLGNLLKENDNNSSVFWNFGDPSSSDNELVSKSISNAMVTHNYTYPGQYTIHSIANVNGVPYHIDQICIIDPD